MRYFSRLILPAVILVAASCVPAKHFQEVRNDKIRAEQERDSLLINNKSLEVKLTELESAVFVMDQEIQRFIRDSTDRAFRLRSRTDELARVTRQLNDLQEAQEALVKGSARETTRLLQQLQETQKDLIAREDRLKEMERDLTQKEGVLERMADDLDARIARLTEVEAILARQDSLVHALHTKISSALRGFEGEGLSVYEKNGKVYVSLQERLLFPTGSTVVNPGGVNALKELGQVLEANPEINILIEGHTDDVPVVPGTRLQDNWDLSVLRATSIVRILLEDTDICQTRLMAGGRGEFMPLDENRTPEARSKNRRTEIILTPRLDELFSILDSN